MYNNAFGDDIWIPGEIVCANGKIYALVTKYNNIIGRQNIFAYCVLSNLIKFLLNNS